MKFVKILLCVALSSLAVGAQARSDLIKLTVQETLDSADAKAKLGDMKFYFGNQKTPKVITKLGDDRTNKKTNAFNKSDEEACRWAFLSALIAFKDKANRLGANAVINIVSNNGNVEFSSPTQFECLVGNVVGGVALKASYAKVE